MFLQFIKIVENLSKIKHYYKDALIAQNVVGVNECILHILGNIAQIYIDTITLKDIKKGYNDLIILPEQYTALNLVDSCFKNSSGTTEAYVRIIKNKIFLYSTQEKNGETTFSYLSMIFLVKNNN